MCLKRKISKRYMSMTEYVIIIAIVAASSLAVIGVFNDRIKAIISGIVSSVSDEDNYCSYYFIMPTFATLTNILVFNFFA